MKTPAHVASSPQNVCPLLNGMRIPQVNLLTSQGDAFDLNVAIGKKPALLVFYRGGW